MNVEDRMSMGEAPAWNGSPLASGSGMSNSPFSQAPIKAMSYGYSSVSNIPSFPSLSPENRLQTLATAAFSDYTTPELDELTK